MGNLSKFYYTIQSSKTVFAARIYGVTDVDILSDSSNGWYIPMSQTIQPYSSIRWKVFGKKFRYF